MGLCIQFKENDNTYNSRFNAWRESKQKQSGYVIWHVPREKYRKEETGKENQLQATCIRNKRHKT